MWIAFLLRVDLGTDATLTRHRANALLDNTTGSSNIALGYNAGSRLNSDSDNVDDRCCVARRCSWLG